ncbi:hypothetical protein F3J20_22480 [Paraburkholderia sp. Cy-641]|uniref:hypothetical protein n=1 Tax=Paraburkholderia sp. Cy-641 TaxID=2608337 RepID=UPI0014240971|nr:hypothetical protein [Paraburkholderia sp. Cy-641]NIF80124.1 hypothetical protein [Paraburkholderia sp. Cy-641]
MKKLMLLAAGIVLCAISFAGCTPAQQADVAFLAATAKAKVTKACGVVQPALLDLTAMIPADPNLALLTKDNGKLCDAVATLDPTNVQSLVDTIIPQALAAVSLLPLDGATQAAIRVALGAAQLALSNWLTAHGSSLSTVAAALPASAVSAASATAASQ